MLALAHIDFGYPWWLNYGHLSVLAAAAAIFVLGKLRGWPKLWMTFVGLLVLWSAAGFLIVRIGFNPNGHASLPTENFLRSGTGRVLDMGAGTGRSSIMVLEARSGTTLVALDLFARSFEQHFGDRGDPRQRLLANLTAAGVDQRTTIETGDIRNLPFDSAFFDAIVSAYAIDHLNREGIGQALSEAARVVKPGGEFLLMLIAKEIWGQIAFGPLLLHGGPRSREWWTAQVRGAGFEVLEAGTRPATLYILARR
jgi:SAM-dependent methyltransferase